MIQHARGDILAADVEALVNAVNTVGVMGKGLALQFKRAYPDMFDSYRDAARRGELSPGRMHVWPTRADGNPRYIINFPTKRHWRSASRLADIETGLASLVETVTELGVSSLAIPPLGCGHGGLDWGRVRPLIEEALAALPGVTAVLYLPADDAPHG